MTTFMAGHGRASITPTKPIHMAGYAGRTAESLGVHDDLVADSLVFSDGETTVLLVALDVCSLDLSDAHALREAVGKETGTPVDRVLITTSHTHAGPLVNHRKSAAFEREYAQWMFGQAVAAAKDACKDLRPARMEAGAAPLDIGCNRRERTPDRRIILGVNPQGATFHEVAVWRFIRDGAWDIVVFSSPSHGTTMGPDNLWISSEWMGDARRKIEARQKDARAVFLQGCCGNQNVYREKRTFEKMDGHGTAACDAVCGALKSTQPVSPLPLGNVTKVAQLPVRGGGTTPCPLHGVRLGEAALIGIGGEAFIEFALFARRETTAKSLFALGYTDGSMGYLPTERAFVEGGYEVEAFKHFTDGKPLDPSVEHVLKREIKALLLDLGS